MRLSTQIVDESNHERFAAVEELEPMRFGGARAADVRFAIPQDRLTPGDYLLVFEASMPGVRTVRSAVRFSKRNRADAQEKESREAQRSAATIADILDGYERVE